MSTEREDFEAWATDAGYELHKIIPCDGGEPRYGIGYAQDLWIGFRAGRTALASAPAAEPIPDLRARLGEAHDASLDDDHRACRAVLMECIRLLDAAPASDPQAPEPHHVPPIEALREFWMAHHSDPQAQVVATRQYYWKDDACQAYNARKPSCICWHDEGTGPLPDGKHPNPGQQLIWRTKGGAA